MKTIFKIVIIFSIVITQIACKKKTKVVDQDYNARLIKILNNSELIADTIQNYISIRIYKIDNGTGSAGYPTSEVSHNLLVAVSGIDEEPEQNLFEIGPFLYPEFKNWSVKGAEKGFRIEAGEMSHRLQNEYTVNLNRMNQVVN